MTTKATKDTKNVEPWAWEGWTAAIPFAWEVALLSNEL